MRNKGAFGVEDQGVMKAPLSRPQPQGVEPSALTPVPVLTSEITDRLKQMREQRPAALAAPGPEKESPLAALSRRVGKAPISPPVAALPPEPVAAPKGEFALGKRPVPTGPRAHELWGDPKTRAKLADVVGKWEQANPGRKLKATHLVQAWNAENPDTPLNEARARTLKSKIDKAQSDYLMSQVTGYLSNGAKKAVLK